MKKGLTIVLAVVVCFAAYLFYAHRKDNNNAEKAKPLTISKNSDAFNNSVQSTLDEYYKMHDALVGWDSAAAIDSLGDSLATLAGNIQFNELKADTLLVRTAQNYASAVVAECNAMKNDAAISEQRKSFYTISENLFDLLRTVQYDKGTVYHVLCPMAFGEDNEGYWLSATREVINPYYGNKDPKHGAAMLHCGSVEDSISFK
ncbi:hypothetical protein A9P82_08210 [Arachidicoccus ginsenosidimutans]|uniref:DUF3347 domain-containing protein n=1 Tax=Arachidicoccus sp. BS20 TaxID=1850526 RepID=UPI0007F05309|nr:DUF3347 domain-containing protein [Arachidicoccus sp. BS20]ANI89274.1 hypothetical protein A9P82_08210 [Arachidicoccus sp. BS20]